MRTVVFQYEGRQTIAELLVLICSSVTLIYLYFIPKNYVIAQGHDLI